MAFDRLVIRYGDLKMEREKREFREKVLEVVRR